MFWLNGIAAPLPNRISCLHYRNEVNIFRNQVLAPFKASTINGYLVIALEKLSQHDNQMLGNNLRNVLWFISTTLVIACNTTIVCQSKSHR